MNAHGYRINTLAACGGGNEKPRVPSRARRHHRLHNRATEGAEAVLLGSAMLGAVAAGRHPSVASAMAAMSAAGRTIRPSAGKVRAFHARKHQVFHRLHSDFLAYRALMAR